MHGNERDVVKPFIYHSYGLEKRGVNFVKRLKYYLCYDKRYDEAYERICFIFQYMKNGSKKVI